MDPTSYTRLVERLESLAIGRAGTVRARAIGLLILGYAYVFALLLATIGTGLLLLWIVIVSRHGSLIFKSGIALLLLGWLIAKSLWVKAPVPEGKPLARGTARELERRLEEIRGALDAPRPDVILLTHDFDASVTQVPRLGIFWWPKTYLTLGVPLLFALTPKQLAAVLAA